MMAHHVADWAFRCNMNGVGMCIGNRSSITRKFGMANGISGYVGNGTDGTDQE
jgi:hypothetical protein